MFLLFRLHKKIMDIGGSKLRPQQVMTHSCASYHMLLFPESCNQLCSTSEKQNFTAIENSSTDQNILLFKCHKNIVERYQFSDIR